MSIDKYRLKFSEEYYEQLIADTDKLVERFLIEKKTYSDETLSFDELKEMFDEVPNDYVHFLTMKVLNSEDRDVSLPPVGYILKYTTVEGKMIEEQIPNFTLSVPNGATEITLTPICAYLDILREIREELVEEKEWVRNHKV